MTAVAITAAICTYRGGPSLRGALASLAKQDLAAERYRVIVVDNAPEQLESTYELSGPSANVRWLRAPSVGLSNARNMAASACGTPLIAFLDDDAVASADWLGAFIATFESFGEQLFAAGGRVDALWMAPRPPWLPDELLGHLSLIDWGGKRRLLDADEWIAGTNMAFRVAALNRVGGFSNKFGRCGGEEVLLSNEENDVVSRLRQQGGEIAYVPDAIVQHIISPERLTQDWIRRRVVWQAVSDYMQRPQELFGRVGGHRSAVERFISSLPAEYQTLHSFSIEQSDPEVFRRQMAALYSHTISLLTGFHGGDG
jgi:GT2 family glycosyltransferase